MRHKNITFSIPEDLKSVLFAQVGNRNRSNFISSAIRKALETEESKLEKELDAAYEAANQDIDRKEVLQEWDAISEWDSDDEDWNWLKLKKD